MKQITTVTRGDLVRHLDSHAKVLPNTKKKYIQILARALKAGVDFSNLHSIIDYHQTLTESNKRTFRAAVRGWAIGIQNQAKLSATPENVATIQAIIWRFEALISQLEVKKQSGETVGEWITFQDVRNIYTLCSDDTNKCKRDRILFGLMCGAGLRRDEVVRLDFSDIAKLPYGENKIRHALNIRVGKGNKSRVVPIRDDLAKFLFEWRKIVGDGPILHAVNRGDAISKKRLSGAAISRIVTNVGVLIGYPELAPHDLRRTFARLAYDSGKGVDLEQLRIILGHSSIETTQKYVNAKVNTDVSACDFTPPISF